MQRRNLHAERLEDRMLLAVNPFHNGFWPEDVDNNLRVTAADMLHIVNEMNESGSRELTPPGTDLPDMADVPYYIDVSGDGALTPLDALRVANTINGGEGETAPSDAVRYRLAVTDLDGNALPNNTVTVGQTFQLRGYVQDVRFQTGSTGNGNATGVFAGYMDVLMTNKDLAQIRYGETQDLRMDLNHPGGVFPAGTITLGFKGQTTGAIPYFASPAEDALAIQQALEALSTVGAGNVEVTTLQGADFEGRFFVRFKRDLGEQDVPQMTVQGTGLQGSYLSDQDINGDGKLNDYVDFTPQPVAVDNYIPINPTTDDQRAALFRSSLTVVDPYTQGRSAVDEPLEAGQPAGSRNLGELGAFLNRNDLNSPPTYTTRKEYHFFTFEIRAVAPGQVSFSGNVADIQKTLVFNIKNTGGDDTTVPPNMIGFYQDINNGTALTVTITAPITVGHDTTPTTAEDTATVIDVLANDSVNAAAGGVAPLVLVSAGPTVNPAGAGTVGVSGNNVTFTPAKDFNGQVTFTYQVRDSKTPTPNTATGSVTVTVTPVNDPPVAVNDTKNVQEDAGDTVIDVLANDNAGPADEPQTLTVSAVGTPDQGGTVQIGDGGANVVYRPRADFFGTEKFTYTARDSAGATAVGTVTVTVTPVNDPPDAVDDTFGGILEDSNATTFNVLLNDSPGPLEQSTDTITIVGVTQGSHGGTVTFTATNVSYKPAADYFGLETFTYTIRDGGGLEDTATVSVTVVNVNDAPDAVNDALEVDEMSSNNVLDVLGNDSPGPLEQQVDAIRVVAKTDPANGTLTIGAGGANVVYTPNETFFGQDTFTYTIRDNSGLEDTATVTVDVVPVVRPRARPDVFDVQEDATAATAPALDVLANDLPNVPNGTVWQVTLIGFGQPMHGTVSLLDNGTPDDKTDDKLRYVPNPDYSGNDSFNYTINDTKGTGADSTTSVTVRVQAVNDPPTLDPIANPAAIVEDAPQQTVGLTGITAGPLETQALQVTATSNNPSLIPNPTVTYTSPNTTGTLSYTPVADKSGTAVVTVTVRDAGLDGNLGTADDGTFSQSFTVTVTPVNDAPTIKAPLQAATKQDADLTFLQGTATEISVADVDNGTLTVGLMLQPDPSKPTVDPGNLILGATAGVTITGGANSSNEVQFTGTLAGVNAALNGLTYDVTPGYEGMPSLQVSAWDGEFMPIVTVGIIVSGINDPPVNLLPEPPVQVAEDNDLLFNGNLQVSDPDAGLFPVEVTLSATHGTLTPVPTAGVTVAEGSIKLIGSIPNINAALNGLKYRPNPDYNGPDQLVISTNDKGNTGEPPAPGQTELIDTDTLAITVTPVNDPPVANDDGSPTDRTMILWNTVDNELDVLANDNNGPDEGQAGETLIITNVDPTNAHGTVTVQNGKLLYTPTAGYTGPAEIVYTVNDRAGGAGLTDTATVYLVVVDFVPSDISGYVFFDFDGDGIKDPGEWGIGGVQLTLTGRDIQGNWLGGSPDVGLSAWTDETGWYVFRGVLPCLQNVPGQADTVYTLTQRQPASLVDGTDTIGDQGGTLVGNDQVNIFLPLFGYGQDSQGNAILGTGNNFAELGFGAEFAGLGLWDLLHSDPVDGAGGAAALLFGTDLFGNLQWYLNLGGWNRYIPGRQSPASPTAFAVTSPNGQLPLTDTAAARVREVNAADEAIRSVYSRTGGWVTRISGDPEDFGLPAYTSAAVVQGEGEGLSETSDAELLAANAGTYEAAVDAVLAEVA